MDTKYEGITRNAEEERLSRETGIGDALVKKIPLGLRSRPTGRGGGALPEQSSDDDGDDDTSATASPGNKGDDNDDDGGDDAESMTSTPTPQKRRRGSKGRCGKKRAKKDFEEELPTEETITPNPIHLSQ